MVKVKAKARVKANRVNKVNNLSIGIQPFNFSIPDRPSNFHMVSIQTRLI